jgi:enamine deaminase RidA (YjgF/YER057c/UK114 family)
MGLGSSDRRPGVNHGTIVYLSGQAPSDASGKMIGDGNFEAQLEAIAALYD